MLLIFIFYMLLIAAASVVNAVIEWRVISGGSVYRTVNVKRFTAPLLTLLYLFLVVIAEKLICDSYAVITDGFVNATAIIVGIAAIVYVVDYCINQYKLRDFDLVEIADGSGGIICANPKIFKRLGKSVYKLKSASPELCADEGLEVGNEIEYLLFSDINAAIPPRFIPQGVENNCGKSATKPADNIKNGKRVIKKFILNKAAVFALIAVITAFGLSILLIG